MNKSEPRPNARWRSGSASTFLILGLIFAVGVWGLSSAIGQDDTSKGRFDPTPTPAVLAGIPDVSAARNVITARSPELSRFIDSVEASDTPSVLAQLQFDRTRCDELISRGVTECSRRGVQSGTELETFRPDGFSGYGLERSDIQAAVDYFLSGRNPRLSFVADRSDESTVLVFAIDEREGLVFPGAIPEGGAPVTAVYFITVPGREGIIATYGYQSSATPPLEFLHSDERSGVRYEILGVADEFRDRDLNAFATVEAASGRSN
jgi:hypothetical protein